jgi:hypothetical protein
VSRNRLLTFVLIALGIILGTIALDALLPALQLVPSIPLPDLLQNYATIFLGIFIEAAPFLLLGSLASGLISEFVKADDLARFMPRNKVPAAIVGSLMGMVFPVCECGVVPVVRRLYQKGFPLSAGIAFLLGAPVLNPVVIASTYAAFGLSPIFWARIILTFVIAVGVGLVFSVQVNPIRVLRPVSLAPLMGGKDDRRQTTDDGIRSSVVGHPSSVVGRPSFAIRLQNAFNVAADDFFDTGRYLVVGILVATTLQVFVSQSALVGLARGPVLSVIALELLAFVISVCSTVDAFIALSFVNTFSIGAIVAFLVFGPMVDIKSTMMFLGIFRRRVVLYIVILTFLATTLAGVFINLYLY